MNPRDYRVVFVSDNNNQVFLSTEEGMKWINITGNLASLTRLVTTIEVASPSATSGYPTLFAGGFGVFRCELVSSATGPTCEWSSVVPNVNPALVLDLHYDGATKVLAAATLGRGAWFYGDWMTTNHISSVQKAPSLGCPPEPILPAK
jgi:hypothetical protein